MLEVAFSIGNSKQAHKKKILRYDGMSCVVVFHFPNLTSDENGAYHGISMDHELKVSMNQAVLFLYGSTNSKFQSAKQSKISA